MNLWEPYFILFISLPVLASACSSPTSCDEVSLDSNSANFTKVFDEGPTIDGIRDKTIDGIRDKTIDGTIDVLNGHPFHVVIPIPHEGIHHKVTITITLDLGGPQPSPLAFVLGSDNLLMPLNHTEATSQATSLVNVTSGAEHLKKSKVIHASALEENKTRVDHKVTAEASPGKVQTSNNESSHEIPKNSETNQHAQSQEVEKSTVNSTTSRKPKVNHGATTDDLKNGDYAHSRNSSRTRENEAASVPVVGVVGTKKNETQSKAPQPSPTSGPKPVHHVRNQSESVHGPRSSTEDNEKIGVEKANAHAQCSCPSKDSKGEQHEQPGQESEGKQSSGDASAARNMIIQSVSVVATNLAGMGAMGFFMAKKLGNIKDLVGPKGDEESNNKGDSKPKPKENPPLIIKDDEEPSTGGGGMGGGDLGGLTSEPKNNDAIEPIPEDTPDLITIDPITKPDETGHVMTARPIPKPEGTPDVITVEPITDPEETGDVMTAKPITDPEGTPDFITIEPITDPDKTGDVITAKPITDLEGTPDVITIEPITDPEATPDVITTQPITDPEEIPDVITTEPITDPKETPDVITTEPITDPEETPDVITTEPITDPEVNPDDTEERPESPFTMPNMSFETVLPEGYDSDDPNTVVSFPAAPGQPEDELLMIGIEGESDDEKTPLINN